MKPTRMMSNADKPKSPLKDYPPVPLDKIPTWDRTKQPSDDDEWEDRLLEALKRVNEKLRNRKK